MTPFIASLAVAAMALTWLVARPLSAQEASSRCRRLHATAESQAFLLGSPTLWLEGVHVPRLGDETGMGLVAGGEYQVRAAMSWSPTELARGVLIIDQSNIECRVVEAAARIRRVIELGDALGELGARREERATLVAAQAEIDAVVAHAEERVAAGVGTRSQLGSVRSEAVRLARRSAQLEAEIARMVEAGHDDLDWTTLHEDLATYESGAVALEDSRSTMRRISPWTVALRGGVVPGDRVDWFGQIQLGMNLGIFAHHAAENELVSARREELADDDAELRRYVTDFIDRVGAGLPGLRDELGHIDTLLRLQEEQHGLLAGLESAEVELTRAMIQLVIVGLRAERAHVASLVSAREALLERAGANTVELEDVDAHE